MQSLSKAKNEVFQLELEWLNPGYPSYKISLKNKSRQTAKNIYCLAIFFDEKQKIIGMDHIKVPEIGGLEKEEVRRESIFTYESGKEEKEFKNWVSRMNDDQRVRVLTDQLIEDSNQLIEKSKEILERVKRNQSITNDEARVYARQNFENFKEINDYNFLAPDMKKKDWQTAILEYKLEGNFTIRYDVGK